MIDLHRHTSAVLLHYMILLWLLFGSGQVIWWSFGFRQNNWNTA